MIAWLFLVSLVLMLNWTGLTFPPHLLELPRFWEVSSAVVVFVGFVALFLFMYVFPDGHFAPRWTRWLALASIAVPAPTIFFPYSSLSLWRYPLLTALVSVGALGTIVFVQVYRYRSVSNATQRQQTKWVVLGIVAVAVGYWASPGKTDTLKWGRRVPRKEIHCAGTNTALPAGVQEGSRSTLSLLEQVDPEDGRRARDCQRVHEEVDQAARGRRGQTDSLTLGSPDL